MADPELKAIHVKDEEFTYGGDDGEVLQCMIDLVRKNRDWKTIKLENCKGRIDFLLEAAMASNVRRLIITSPEEDPFIYFPALANGLTKSTCKLLTLCLHNIPFTDENMALLCQGLDTNTSVMELSFQQSTFSLDGIHRGAHARLSQSLPNMKSLHQLSFQNCNLTDVQSASIVSSLIGLPSFIELSLDGNQCQTIAMNALAKLLSHPNSSLLVLDLSSQKLPGHGESLDLFEFSRSLSRSRLSCLQLSDNPISFKDLAWLAIGLQKSKSLKMLHLAWCKLGKDTVMEAFGKALSINDTLNSLVLYECEIDDEGIAKFATYLPKMNGLRRLDLGGQQKFSDSQIENSMAPELSRNLEMEEVVLRKCGSTNILAYYCDLNRAGRRFFRFSENTPVGLWPLILGRITTMKMPLMYDPWLIAEKEEIESPPLPDEDHEREQTMRRASALFHLVRNSPLLATGIAR